jgi:hypothetical protein
MIFVMGVTMLKVDRGQNDTMTRIFSSILTILVYTAKVKWRVKLEKAFDGSSELLMNSQRESTR